MSNASETLSDLAAAAVEAGAPYVVRVDARRRPASGVVWSSDGLVVTADHVVHRDEGVMVGLPDGESVPATLVGRDPSTDLALLQIQTEGLAAAAWRDVDGARVGHVVLALGRPGRTVRATLGILSALGGSWRTPAGGEVDTYIETDAAPLPGFSGGALVDTAGRVLGVHTTGLVRGAVVTVPTVTVRRVVDALRAHGRIRRGFLGIATHAVPLPPLLRQQLGQRTGLLVFSIEQDGPAARAGVVFGDTIVALGGQPVRRVDDLWGLLGEGQIGTSVPLRVVRAGELRDLPVVPGERRSARAG
ncbi:MAG TPA: trypsin-like peptidase domain-containing protein [bacterium]|nr:trypsin-like peptidase domain-containing protein [bacterium]